MGTFGTKPLTGLALAALLAGCGGDGTNPFLVDEEITNDLEEGDPNINLGDRYAFNPETGLTMNDVQYIENDDGSTNLIINNLPFDGSSKTYDETGIPLPGSTVYRSSTRTIGGIPTDGVVTYYAVYVEADHVKGIAVAGEQWSDFGYAGANIRRDSYSIPDAIDGVDTTEFRYVGVYAGTRKMSDGSGMELTAGSLNLFLDITDFDPSDETGLQGAITGSISNKQSFELDGTFKNDMPDVALKVVSFDLETGTWTGGAASDNLADGVSVKSTGEFDGLLAGENGNEIGGYLVTEGIAHSEQVEFQVVTYEIPQFDPITGAPLIDPLTGSQLVIEGSYSALDEDGTELANALVSQGVGVPLLTVNASDLPPGAIVTSTDIDDIIINSDFNAKEVGVFVGEQIEGDFD